MKNTGVSPETLQFIFTENGFYPDAVLYQMGFQEKAPDATPAGAFLRMLVDTFFRILTSMPELELAREQVEPVLSKEEADKLQAAVPFVIGAEYTRRGGC